MTTRTADEIWADDLLGRRGEAELLIAYLESVSTSPRREDGRAFSLAVDVDYGRGKTFFLKRFAEQMSLTHPVRYIDAWRDDFADEPLVALAATIKDAAGEAATLSKQVKPKLKAVLEQSGKVAKIAAIGAAKKLAGLAITSTAVDQIEALQPRWIRSRRLVLKPTKQ